MPCLHKFIDDLNLHRLDFTPVTLIIGTFNPGWAHLGNNAQWFYGRTQNNYFWDVLPKIYGYPALRNSSSTEWKLFCKLHRIALTDLIASIDDADPENPGHVDFIKSYRDDLITCHFKQFTFIDIPHILQNHPTINQTFLTRSVNDRFWFQRWQPIQAYCLQHGIKAYPLLTPSASARFQIPKGEKISLNDFIFNEWQKIWLKS